MENLFLILATTFILSRTAYKYGFKKYSIANSGCTILLPEHAGDFSTSFTIARDLMHFNETVQGNVTYGSVTIQLMKPADTLAEAEKMLAQFMYTLQASNDIDINTGITLGFTQSYNALARGIVDYWQDADGIDWKTKGWTNGRVISVLYIRNINQLPVAKQEMYLDSFRFA
jgi:hypothetical protein